MQQNNKHGCRYMPDRNHIGGYIVYGGITFLTLVMAAFITNGVKDNPKAIATVWIIEFFGAACILLTGKCFISTIRPSNDYQLFQQGEPGNTKNQINFSTQNNQNQFQV